MFNKKIILYVLVLQIFSVYTFAQEDQDRYYLDSSEEEQQPEQLAEDISDLTSLEALKDVAVIQKKYLDKTGRFELYGGLNIALNSQFFNLIGGNIVGSYHFNERWGVEVQGLFSSDLEKSITEKLSNGAAIDTKAIVTPKTYYGAHLRWSPIYGKISLREKTINPFEVYFTLGLGLTNTDDSQSAFTLHAGVGQVYPISKNTTFRWGLGFNNFTSNAKENLNGANRGKEVNTSLFYLNAGFSIFFPFTEAR